MKKNSFTLFMARLFSREKYSIDANGVLTRYTGPGGDVSIPAGVTRIGDKAFRGCNSLTSVTIPCSVTSIGYRAFVGCERLASVIISGSTNLDFEVFGGCDKLSGNIQAE